MCRSLGGHCGRWPWQRRQTLRDEHGQVEHPEADRDREKPSVQLTGDPVEANQLLFHRRPHAFIPRFRLTYAGYAAMQHKKLVNLCKKTALIAFAVQANWVGSGVKTANGGGIATVARPRVRPPAVTQGLRLCPLRLSVV
jgi:hypothetical protein